MEGPPLWTEKRGLKQVISGRAGLCAAVRSARIRIHCRFPGFQQAGRRSGTLRNSGPGGVCLSRRIPGAPPKPAPISGQNCLCQAVVNALSPPPPGVRRPASADGGTAGEKQSSRRSHAVPWGMMTFSTRIFPSSASAVIMVIS